MEEENKEQRLELLQELHILGNKLTTSFIELSKEVDNYTERYYEELFIQDKIVNDINGEKRRKEIKKGETYFDKIQETIMRNDIITEVEKTIETLLTKITEKMN